MNPSPLFRVLVVVSKADDHAAIITAAKPFFEQLAAEHGFAVDFTYDVARINAANLQHYQVFIMFQLAPFEMNSDQQAAAQAFIEEGKGWVGAHAAGLTGRAFLSPDRPYWQWFEDLLGGITYTPHPAYQKGSARVEDHEHPVTKNVPDQFELSDEWYEFDRSPRGQVRVLAVADETSYRQNKPMGDHPIVWVNESYRRAVYIALGHDPSALENEAYARLLRQAVLWAASQS